jgi:copper chaperone CopZ
MYALALVIASWCAQGTPPVTQPVTDTIALRYYYNANAEPTSMKLALDKVPGVQKITFDVKNRHAMVTWNGKCSDLPKLEEAAAKSGTTAYVISHATMTLQLKPGSEAKGDIIKEELGLIKGTQAACLQCAGTTAVIHADLRVVTLATLKKAAQNADFEFTLKSPPAWVEIALADGDVYKAILEVEKIKGVLILNPDAKAKTITLWVRDVKDDALKAAVEKSGVKLEKITRP